MKLRILGVLAFFGCTLIHAKNSVINGRVVRLLQGSPVFQGPSPKSSVLADVDQGTVVILRKLSPKKTWLFVEDEDGNRGWIPRNRSDFVDLAELAPTKATKDPTGQDQDSSLKPAVTNDKKDEKVSPENSQSSQLFSLVFRRSFQDPPGKWAAGPAYAYLFPSFSQRRPSGSRASRMFFESAYLWVPKKNQTDSFTIPLRWGMFSQKLDSSWATGPDFTLYYMRHRSSEDKNKWSLGYGYTVGYLPLRSGFIARLRGGLEVFHKTRLSIEFNVGYLL